jgi:hypothetical protein
MNHAPASQPGLAPGKNRITQVRATRSSRLLKNPLLTQLGLNLAAGVLWYPGKGGSLPERPGAADERFRPRPARLSGRPALIVAIFRRGRPRLQHGTAIANKPETLSTQAVFQQPAGLSVHARWLGIVLLSGLVGVAAAKTSASAGDAQCRTLFTRDDPALFDFVDTRDTVDFARYRGMEIAGIDTVVLPIFNEDDPEENNWFFRTANKLHINTRASTIDRQMIIQPGSQLKPPMVRENERILRAREYLIDAMILPGRICGDRIHLLVVVRDVWTLNPTASASRSGGENSASAGITESNLAGTGQKISVGHFNNADRSGTTFAYMHPYILGEHTRLRLDLADNSDGELQSLKLTRPFFELDTRWEASMSLRDRLELKTIEENAIEINQYRRERRFRNLQLGWSPGRQNGMVHRWRMGFTDDQTNFKPVDRTISAPPADERLRYPWLSWTAIEDRFKTLSNLTQSHRHEDILLGLYNQVRLGYARESWQSTQNAWIFDLTHEYTASFGEHHLLRLGASAQGRYKRDSRLPEDTVYAGRTRYYHFPDPKNRWFARFRYAVGRNLENDSAFTSGGADTLRGYPDDIQRGNRQWLFTVERRRFTDMHLFNLVYLGGAAYIDAGRTWATDARGAGDHAVLSNLGLGLRVTPSKFNVNEVLHIDIAWPLAERDRVDSFQIIVEGRVDF